MDYSEFVDADRRLAILRFLSEQADYSLNEGVTQMALKGVGHTISRTAIAADFDWLAERKLVTITSIGEGRIRVAWLTQLGSDVAQGLEQVEGVKRPGPG